MSDYQGGSLQERICSGLDAVRRRRPLIHNITNFVVMNFTANALLSLGASPVMAHAPEEMEEMVRLADALVINIGTLSSGWVRSMHLAAKAAGNDSTPVVLDPVGAGATRFRTETARELTARNRISIIRGNASEIHALAGGSSQTRGVDSAECPDDAASSASELARHSGTVVAATGPVDFVTDGVRSVRIANGHSLMGRVTGTGCAASAITGAFAAVEPDPFVAAVGALVCFGIAGESAARSNPGPGSFHVLLLDALDALTADDIRERAKIREE
ncbi:MAG: hydroxyethylthiazole kinase [Syntrophobacteraceae bacterium]|nr:hydroxyethylthiazole kinase [Desulfobacteraceae bacterium]